MKSRSSGGGFRRRHRARRDSFPAEREDQPSNGSLESSEVRDMIGLRTWLDHLGRINMTTEQICWFFGRLLDLGKLRCDRIVMRGCERHRFIVHDVGPEHDRLLRPVTDYEAMILARLFLEGKLCFAAGVERGYRYLIFLTRGDADDSTSAWPVGTETGNAA
jgi:hypothetical protein